jgi:hypothetical protein
VLHCLYFALHVQQLGKRGSRCTRCKPCVKDRQTSFDLPNLQMRLLFKASQICGIFRSIGVSLHIRQTDGWTIICSEQFEHYLSATGSPYFSVIGKFAISPFQKATFSTKISKKLCHQTRAKFSFWQHSPVQECMRCHTFCRILDSGYKMMTRNQNRTVDHIHTSRKPSRRFEIANEELRLLVSVFSEVNSRA